MGFFQALGADDSITKFQNYRATEQTMDIQKKDAANRDAAAAAALEEQNYKNRENARKEEMLNTPVFLDTIEAMDKESPNSQYRWLKERFADKFQTDQLSGRKYVTMKDATLMAQSITGSQEMMKKMFDLRVGDHVKKLQEVNDEIVKMQLKSQEDPTTPINEEKMKKLQQIKKIYEDQYGDFMKISLVMSGDKGKEAVMQNDRKVQEAEWKASAAQAKLEMTKEMFEWKQKQADAVMEMKEKAMNMSMGNLQLRAQELAVSQQRMFETMKQHDVNNIFNMGKFVADGLKTEFAALKSSNNAKANTAIDNITSQGGDINAMLLALNNPKNASSLEPHQLAYMNNRIRTLRNQVSGEIAKKTGIQVGAPMQITNLQQVSDLLKQYEGYQLDGNGMINILSMTAGLDYNSAQNLYNQAKKAMAEGKIK